MEQLICDLVRDDIKTHLLCCFQSGAVNMALAASLSLCPPTLWAFQLSLSGPPSLPKPSNSLLFLCLVLCLRPSLIRCAGSSSHIYKHLKYLPLSLSLPCLLKRIPILYVTIKNAYCLTNIQTAFVCFYHILASALYSLYTPLSACTQHFYWPFLCIVGGLCGGTAKVTALVWNLLLWEVYIHRTGFSRDMQTTESWTYPPTLPAHNWNQDVARA